MHRAAFAWAGLNGDYQAVRVSAEELPGRVNALRLQAEVLGVNLSLPHKEAVLPLLDSLSAEASRIGAVNTVVSQAGQLRGHNTDAPGLLHALQDAGFAASSGPLVVLGAGGAARAALYVALHLLGRDVYLLNRTRAKAEELARAWPSAEGSARVVLGTPAQVPWADIDLIINSSSAGLNRPDETPLVDFNWRQCPQAAVYDMVYKPAETRLMREAQAAGLRAENGLGMLAWQAKLAFGHWTGVDVPVSVFLQAAREGRA